MQIVETESYELLNCGECGINFYVPVSFYQERRKRSLGWNCPNGHSRIFRKSEVEELKEKLEAERQKRLEAENRERQKIVELNAMESKLKRVKNRISKGVCTKCNRYFKNLHSHFETKHKEKP